MSELSQRVKASNKESPDNDIKEIDEQEEEDENESAISAIIMLFCIFTAAFLAMMFLFLKSPPLSSSDVDKIKLPRDMNDAKALGKVLSSYTDDYFPQVLVAFVLTYIFLQSFAIPGSIFLSILSGFLFPFPLALFLVCLCSACGASFCYLLSSILAKKVVKKYFSARLKTWKAQISRHDKDLLSYITFLRITPFLPNWFINIASPVINVPLLPFFLGTFFGVAPPSFGFISAGVELYELTTTGDAFSIRSLFIVIGSAIVSLLPVLFRKSLRKKIQ